MDWIQEVSYNVRKIDVLYKNKQHELNSRGFDVTVGMLFTAATLFLPDTMAALKPALTSIFSGRTVYDGLRWLYDFRHSKDLLRNEEQWILWRLKQKH